MKNNVFIECLAFLAFMYICLHPLEILAFLDALLTWRPPA